MNSENLDEKIIADLVGFLKTQYQTDFASHKLSENEDHFFIHINNFHNAIFYSDKKISIEFEKSPTSEDMNVLTEWIKNKKIIQYIVGIGYSFKNKTELKHYTNLQKLTIKISNHETETYEINLNKIKTLLIDTNFPLEYLNKNSTDNLRNLIIKNFNNNKEPIETIKTINYFKEIVDLNILENSSNIKISDIKSNNLKSFSCIHQFSITDLKNFEQIDFINGNMETSVDNKKSPIRPSVIIFHDISFKQNRKVNLDNINTSKLERINTLGSYNLQFSDDIPTLSSINLHHINNESTGYTQPKIKLSDLSVLPNLTTLDVTNGSIDVKMDPSLIHKKLTSLNIRSSNVSDLNFLHHFPNIQYINASHNKIENIKPLITCKHLINADFSHNMIVDIPPDLTLSHSFVASNRYRSIPREEYTINIANNPLINPPIEIVERGSPAIDSYFTSMTGETEELNEAKIVFLGNGEVGKTSLMKAISGNDFNPEESTTHGINLCSYTIPLNENKNINTFIWDFGGQQIMHATHQLFLSRRCVYVLVINDRKEDIQQDQKIEYWLQQIQTFGDDSKVIIIRNKSDLCDLNNLQEGKLREKFPNLVAIESFSCKTLDNLERVKNKINDLVRQLPMRKVQLSKNWVNIKNKIKDLSREKDHLPLSTFVEICKQHGVNDKEAQSTLRNLLHDLSVIIAFDGLDGFDMGILNPQWITEGIYTIINSKTLAKRQGFIALSEAQRELDDAFPDKYTNKAQFIIESMCQFELCHSVGISSSKKYLVPNLLPIEPSCSKELNTEQNTIKFIFKYNNLLPPSLFPNFLVRMNSQASPDKRWRNGVILTEKDLDAQALIEQDGVDKTILVKVSGTRSREFFTIIRHNIRELNKHKLQVSELIPLENQGDTVGYQELIGHEIENKAEYFNGNLRKSYSVSRLLSGIESREDTEKSKSEQAEGRMNVHIKVDAPTINNTNTNTVSNSQSQSQKQSVDIAIEVKNFIDNASFLMEDIWEELESEVTDEVDKRKLETEFKRINKSIGTIATIKEAEDLDSNRSHFARVNDFLTSAIDGTSKVGKALQTLGDTIGKVKKLAKQYNKVASCLGIPVVPTILLD